MGTLLAIRSAKPADLAGLERIENRCFAISRRSSRAVLRRSLRSPSQRVLLAVCQTGDMQEITGAMVLHIHPHTVRIYSVAVLPAFRGSGTGRALMDRAVESARRDGKRFVSLEADRRNRRLLRWYESQGFAATKVLKDYYSPGRDAVRLRLDLRPAAEKERACGRS